MARAYGIGLAWVLGLAAGCAPGEGLVGETETETETETTGSTGDDASSMTFDPSQTGMTDPTNASQTASQGSNSADETETNDDEDEEESTAGDDSTAGSDGSCPPGGTGCPCDIGSMCEGDLVCMDGVCVEAPECDEPEGEPNDDEASAVPLETATCGAEPATIDAGLFGEDADWYLFELEQVMFCFPDPSAEVTIEVEDLEVTVCIYAVCPEDGTPSVSCGFGPGASDPSESPDGHQGCCDDDGTVSLESATCDFFQTPPGSAEISVTADTADACVPYTLAWSN
jgi:hypothetical protein